MKPPTSVILFDIGGVLVELNGMPSLQRLIDGRCSIDEVSKMWEESEAVNLYETGKIGRQEFAVRNIAQFDLSLSTNAFLEEFSMWPRRLHDNAKAVLNLANENHQIAALSNISEMQWEHVGQALGIEGMFKHKFLSFEIGYTKPAPEAYHAAIDGLGVNPDEILFLDDNLENVSQALSLGMQSVCVGNSDEAMAVLEGALKVIG